MESSDRRSDSKGLWGKVTLDLNSLLKEFVCYSESKDKWLDGTNTEEKRSHLKSPLSVMWSMYPREAGPV